MGMRKLDIQINNSGEQLPLFIAKSFKMDKIYKSIFSVKS